jgi:hypothetical protein
LFGLSLMVTQAFSYNAILHYTLVLTDFYDIPGDLVGWYLLPSWSSSPRGPGDIQTAGVAFVRYPVAPRTPTSGGACVTFAIDWSTFRGSGFGIRWIRFTG